MKSIWPSEFDNPYTAPDAVEKLALTYSPGINAGDSRVKQHLPAKQVLWCLT